MLVILLLVVLVVFGVAALTTALSNVRLGQKVVDWNEKYYAAEAQANEIYAQIDKAVDETCQSYVEVSYRPDSIFTDSVEALGLDIKSTVDENLEFTYETWHSDVGIRVTLSLKNRGSGELEVTQWKAMQK